MSMELPGKVVVWPDWLLKSHSVFRFVERHHTESFRVYQPKKDIVIMALASLGN